MKNFFKILGKIKKRIYFIIPAFNTWFTFILALAVSFWQPIWALYFIILFGLFWIIRILYLIIHELASWHKYKQSLKVDWWQKVQDLKGNNWQDYWHLIFLPTYKESFEVIDKSLAAIAASNYDISKFIVVLAGEERDKENFEAIAARIKAKYENDFHKLLITLHSADLPDEIPGKGSNLYFAGHEAQKYINELGVNYDNVIVSIFDIDTRPHPMYFAILTYQYLTSAAPTRASYQPIALYYNNIWDSDPLTRIVANSTSFWLLTELGRSDRLFTFSSHSMSFRALVDIGFWEKTIVTEDSRIFLQCLFRYDGDYRVEPVYMPVYMNTVATGNFWRAIVDQYKQMRRWAWGIEHFPYMMDRFKLHPRIPFMKKFKYLFNMVEGQWSWATAPILLTVLGRLPLWLADRSVQATALAQLTPLLLQKLMTIGMVGVVLNAVLMMVILPEKPKEKLWLNYMVMFFEWALLPVTMIIFGSIPATDAQTRLMLGGRFKLGFWVSRKK